MTPIEERNRHIETLVDLAERYANDLQFCLMELSGWLILDDVAGMREDAQEALVHVVLAWDHLCHLDGAASVLAHPERYEVEA